MKIILFVSLIIKMCSILGYEKNEMMGKYLADFVSPDDKDRLNAQLVKKFTGNTNSDYYADFPFVTKNGQVRIIRWSNAFLRDSDGKIVFVLKSGEDVTEKKKEEKVQMTISQILSASNSEVNIDELFKYIHVSIKKLMPAENFYIALYERQNNEIRFAYFVDQYDKVIPTKRFGKGLTEYVIRSGKSILCDDDRHNELEKQGEVELIGAPSKIWLGVPLSNSG